MDAWTFQKGERHQLERLLTERQETNGEALLTASLTSPNNSLPAVTGGLVGRIEIQRIGLSVIVVEGTSTTTLRRAVGHIPGTALPGQPGNVGISGHRDTFFRPLRNIQQNDIITLITLVGEFRYRVVFTKVVSPDDVAVLDPSGIEILTLVTCYPFYFVGSAPDRFIVRAERVYGHTQDFVLKESVQKGTAFLQKPFTPVGLAQKVRETLDAEPRPAGRP